MKVERNALISELSKLKASGYTYLVKITAVDYVSTISVLYFLRNLSSNKDEIVEVALDPGDAHVPSVIGLYKAADWYERELYEMFGVEIKGRHVERLLLKKWNGKGAPLRKNFEWGKPYETKEV